MAKELKTGWVCIATSGPVVHGGTDGRFIKKEWLQDIAKNFNTKVHTPMLWPEHRRWHTFGKVVAVKLEEVTEGPLTGELQLFAIICPDEALMNANKAGEYRFCSIEVGENFLSTGEYFLEGVGVTNEPASAGVTEMKFSKDSSGMAIQSFEFNVNDHLVTDDNDDEEPLTEAEAKGLRRLFNLFKNSNTETPDEDENSMKSEQAEQLITAMNNMASSFSALQAQITGKPTNDEKTGGEGGEPETTEYEFSAAGFSKLLGDFNALKDQAQNGESVSADQFNTLKAAHEELQKQFKTAINEEVDGSDADADEGGDDEEPCY